MKNVWIFCILAILFRPVLYSQTPARDNFNLVFENNFNDDVLGKYQVTDYLQDFTPQPTTIPSQSKMDIIQDADPKYNKFMRGYFPLGTYLPDQHGYLFMSYLKNPVTELYFSYDVRLKPGFNYVKGGKIPGLTGGKIVSGVKPSTTDGFSTRMMWTADGRLVFYVYHQDQDIIYGNSYYWGNFVFTTGKWYNLTIRVVVNTINNGIPANDGILEGFIDGKLMFQKKDFKFRSLSSILIDNMYIVSFFGGNTPDFATTRDEWIDTDNFVAFTYTAKPSDVPRGNVMSSPTKTLLHPYSTFGATVPTVPATPSGLTYSSLSINSATLKWNDNCGSEQGFKIECRPDASSTYSQIATVPANTTTFTHNGLTSGNLYHYRVCSYNTAGNSSYSNILDASIPLPASTGPVAQYTFENSVADITGNGHNGTLVNGATYSAQYKQGTKSLSLDGVNDYVDIGTFNLGNQFTFSSWVYIPSGSANIHTLIANTNSGAGNGFKVMVNSYGTSDRSVILETGNGTQMSKAATNASVFAYNAWNHVAVTVDRSAGIARIYYNGVDMTSTSALVPNFNTNQPTRLGIMNNSVFPLKSNLDDVRIYNRVLTGSEVSSLFTSLTTPAVPAAPSALVATAGTNSINLAWNDNSSDESGFKVERSLAQGTGYSLVFTSSANIKTYTDQNVNAGITYYYRVKSFNTAGTSASSNECSAMISGLTAHYTFENSATDISGNGHNGTLYNGPTYSANVKEGIRSIMLDGVNDYVDIGTFDLGTRFTFASWVYIPSGTLNIRTVIANTSSGYSDGFKIVINTYGTNDRKIILETGNGTQFAQTTSPASTWIFDRWNHIAVTVDKTTGTARIYFNGANVTTSSALATNFATNKGIKIGSMANSVCPLRGNLDDLRIYNRVLSDSEINGLTTLSTLKAANQVFVSMDEVEENVPSTYPNPFRDHLTINSQVDLKSIEIFNMLGVKVYAKYGIESREFTINDFDETDGMYLIRITNVNDELYTYKIMRSNQ